MVAILKLYSKSLGQQYIGRKFVDPLNFYILILKCDVMLNFKRIVLLIYTQVLNI